MLNGSNWNSLSPITLSLSPLFLPPFLSKPEPSKIEIDGPDVPNEHHMVPHPALKNSSLLEVETVVLMFTTFGPFPDDICCTNKINHLFNLVN